MQPNMTSKVEDLHLPVFVTNGIIIYHYYRKRNEEREPPPCNLTLVNPKLSVLDSPLYIMPKYDHGTLPPRTVT